MIREYTVERLQQIFQLALDLLSLACFEPYFILNPGLYQFNQLMYFFIVLSSIKIANVVDHEDDELPLLHILQLFGSGH